MALLDLDVFKTINDTRGHAEGDAVLVALAQRIRQELRRGDTPARLGGEEFVIPPTPRHPTPGAWCSACSPACATTRA